MTERTNNPLLWLTCGATTPRDLRNQRRLLLWSLSWAAILVASSFAIRTGAVGAGPVGWLVAALPSIVAIFAFLAFVRFVSEADELQRIIQLRGLALGFGAGLLAMAGYPQFERLGAPVLDAEIYFVAMVLAYSIGCVAGAWRYR